MSKRTSSPPTRVVPYLPSRPIALAPEPSSHFDELKELEIPRKVVEAWKGEVSLIFQDAELQFDDEGEKFVAYVLEVSWQIVVEEQPPPPPPLEMPVEADRRSRFKDECKQRTKIK